MAGEVESGRAAGELLETTHADAVVVDMQRPEDGLTLTRTITRARAAMSVIVLGGTDWEYVEQAVEAVAIEVELGPVPMTDHTGSRSDLGGTGPRRVLAGFENHGGRTRLGNATPLGRVLKGHGNDGTSGFEGVRTPEPVPFFGDSRVRPWVTLTTASKGVRHDWCIRDFSLWRQFR